MSLRVIALGQRLAGDDGVGMAIYDEIAKQNHNIGVDLKKAAEPSALLDLLQTGQPVLVVDALLGMGSGAKAGRLHWLSLDELSARRIATVSTHGLDVAAAAALARELFPESVSPSIRVLGIEILKAEIFSDQMSEAVAAVVPEAVRKIDEIAKQFEKN